MDKRVVIGSALVFSLLSACGGGSTSGGGSVQPIPAPSPPPPPPPPPPPTTFTNWQSAPSNGVVRLVGETTEASHTKNGLGQIGSFNTPTAGTVTADVTNSNNAPTGISLSATTASINFTNSDGSTRSRLAGNPNIIKYASPSGATSVLSFDAVSAGFSYLTFGSWNGVSGTTGYLAGFYAGSLTPAGAVPTTGTATYRGSSVGYLSGVNSAIIEVTSDITLTANFATRSILYSTVAGQSISGTLTYDAGTGYFRGTLSEPDYQRFGVGFVGPASGRFYGPGAQELAGSFVLSKPLNQYVGAFGAKRQ